LISESSPPSSQKTGQWQLWASVLLSAAILIWFHGVETHFGDESEQSSFSWIFGVWNREYELEHGIFFPFVIGGLIIYRFKDLKAAEKPGSAWGLLPVFVGVLFYIFAYRFPQPRISLCGLPIILWGAAWFLWGWRVAKMLAFPLFFFLLAIPWPRFQNDLWYGNFLTVSLAHHGCSLFGIQTSVEGTHLFPTNNNLPVMFMAGCSNGIPSLMTLLMISGAWACMAKIAIWKKVLIFLSAFPLAILGNAQRMISVFVIAEYGDPKWARSVWYDWSKLLLVYPFSVLVLLLIHTLLAGRLPWKMPTNAPPPPFAPDREA
jgi:exosortase